MSTQIQKREFNKIWDALTFKIYTGKPDSAVSHFLENHFPYLVKHPKPGGWMMYPPDNILKPLNGMHSLQVDKHPFIKTEHLGARIDFFTQEWNKGPSSIVRTRISIYFARMADLTSAYSNIISSFKKVGSNIDELKYPNHIKAIVKRSAENEQWDSLCIVLSKNSKHRDYSISIEFEDDVGDPW